MIIYIYINLRNNRLVFFKKLSHQNKNEIENYTDKFPNLNKRANFYLNLFIYIY